MKRGREEEEVRGWRRDEEAIGLVGWGLRCVLGEEGGEGGGGGGGEGGGEELVGK